jgi:hypothetical protein
MVKSSRTGFGATADLTIAWNAAAAICTATPEREGHGKGKAKMR